jgi:hypothetical protein
MPLTKLKLKKLDVVHNILAILTLSKRERYLAVGALTFDEDVHRYTARFQPMRMTPSPPLAPDLPKPPAPAPPPNFPPG